MYAVISTGGKQYKVSTNDIIDIEQINEQDLGKSVEFDKVLALGEGGDLKIGDPYLKDAKVEGEILENFRGKKLITFKKKRKKGYHRKQGHRQNLIRVKISKIET